MRHLRLNAWRGPNRRIEIDSPVRASWITVICLAILAPAFAQSPKPVTTIDSAAFNQDGDGARIVLSADGPLLYTSYEPRPDLLVVDLTGASVSATFAAPAVSGTLVTDIKVEPINELGHLQTRLSIHHTDGLKYEISSQGRALAIAFEAPASAAEPSSPAVTTTAEPPAPVSSSPIAAAEPPAPVAPAPEVPRPAVVTAAEIRNVPTGEIARTLERIEVSGTGSDVSVALIGDGVLQANNFELQNPPRLVVDFPGLKTTIHPHIQKGSGPVKRIRVSQFRNAPDRIVRVVLDLSGAPGYQVERNGERFVVRFDGRQTVTNQSETKKSPVSRTEVAEVAEAAPAATPAQTPAAAVSEPVAEKPAPEAPIQQAAVEPASPPVVPASKPETVVTEKPAPPAAAPAVSPAPQAASAASAGGNPPKTNLPALVTSPGVDSIPAGKRAPGVLDARRVPRKDKKTVAAPKSADDVLFESAEAMLADPKSPTERQDLANSFSSKTMGGGEPQYTGEPVSLDLKDADIKDVFRTISELTGLNIVIDPDVHGTVTVRLENVPWDQALELILKQNGLGYILENNVMRIATTAKLQQEETQRASLDAARQQSVPTKTVIKRLSYADAGETASTVKKIMSPRGDVIVDERTNTLIIREIQDYMPTVIQLIESLDSPTPQVEIESRIVETTKSFGRNLGINWGFNGVSSAATGNTTNLSFPNSGTVAGTVGLAAAATNSLQLTLGNVLDSFNLNIALQAAENQGLVRIVSAPKISALTNQKAYIQSGLQVPVQTVVNNTTSTVYIDATLRLEVTPKITAEGTVMLNLHVQNKTAQFALNPQGGANVPIAVREAQTRLIVKDGGTAVIGGIFQSDDEDQYNEVPGLWKVPIFGALFRNSNRSDTHEELLIFVTPRIIH